MPQPISNVIEDNLHHPDQPDYFPSLKKCEGCHTSNLWELFTWDVDPQRQTCSTCRHSHKSVAYHKKSERVKDHLIKCDEFAKSALFHKTSKLIKPKNLTLNQAMVVSSITEICSDAFWLHWCLPKVEFGTEMIKIMDAKDFEESPVSLW